MTIFYGAAMPWTLTSKKGVLNGREEKSRLNPLGGRPVEMWTRQAP